MFSLRHFIMEGLLSAIGKLADYQIIMNAVGWHTKAVLTAEDLELLGLRITEKNGISLPLQEENAEAAAEGEAPAQGEASAENEGLAEGEAKPFVC